MGFAGGALAAVLSRRGEEVYGIDARPGCESDGVFQGSVCDVERMEEVLARVEPDYVFHLAAQASEGKAWEDPAETLQVNMLGTMNVLNAAWKVVPQARVLVVSSSAVYGQVYPEELPLTEEQPLRPLTPYALSKVAQDFAAYQAFLSRGQPVVRVRPFNHIGPGQAPVAAVPSFAQQIAAIEAGKRPPVIEVGNLEAERDILDVRDVVQAFVLLAEKGTPGEAYNVCAGRAYRMQWILDTLLAMSTASIEVVQDPARMRPSDVPIQIGDHSKLYHATQWSPEIPMEQTLVDVLAYWRERVEWEEGKKVGQGHV
jgi:GDP-4-dehydro-6-deoxy-D-mannose reductase